MQLVLKEKVFSIKDRFEVTDDQQNVLYTVEGKLLS